jgi:hypothetical protein
MKKTIAGIGFFFLAANAFLSAALSKPIVNYDLKARLVPAEKMIQGSEVLTWLNDSDTPVSELQFHLYLNAFKNNRSTFMKESGGSNRSFKADKENWGYCEVKKIQIINGPDLTRSMSFIQPDDRNADDQTVMRVSLPEPVKPQSKITLAIEFVSKMPRVFARSGFSGDFYMIAQWFPKIGVFWNDAWNCHQYHSQSEFFADFGVYKVEITVPEKFVVGATGRRIGEKKNNDGTKTYTHYQEDVHDFAWTACPDFVEFKEKYVLNDPRVETEMILLVHRSHLKQKDRYARALRHGLEFYSRSYGAYPYPTITLVDPAPGALAAGGMEYPTLFTAGKTSYLPEGWRKPEMVTIHEFGHGYWYGIVGSNEFEEAWLDEGINSYSEVKAMSKYYGQDSSMIDFWGLKIGDFHFQRLSVIGSGRMDPILKNSWDYASAGSYGLNVYDKASLMLLTLEKYLGEDVMANVMRAYFEKWKFRHPTSKDFIKVAEEISGRDLGWFFNQVLSSPDKLDYAVGDLKSVEIQEPEGYFNGKLVEPINKKGDKHQAATNKIYKNEVLIVRYGEWIFPQDILIAFENGEKIRETWDGRDRWKRFIYAKPYKLAYAQVDPDRIWLLDVNYGNNSRVLAPKKAPIRKYALGLMAWFQHLLSFVSF